MGFSFAAAAQQVEQDVPVLSEDIAGRLDGFSYKEGPESELEFRGTAIALGAEGDAEVEFQEGRARVDVDVEDLPNPASFGPFATYVLWAVTADGNASNLGSIEVRNGDGSLEATTPLSQFGLIISAEPHFAVTVPSRAIVLQNLGKRVQGQQFNIPGLKQRIDYSALATQRRDESTKFLVRPEPGPLRARDRGGCRRRSPRGPRVRAGGRSPGAGRGSAWGQEVVRAQSGAPDRARSGADCGGRASQGGDRAGEGAERSGDPRRARVGRAEGGNGSGTRGRGSPASRRAATSSAARADLVARLNRALPTRETPRGIVAELAGVEFATGAATLSASARESLARFAGIVGVYPSLRILVEGHTDSTGSLDFNRTLSYERALAVRDYLATQGVTGANLQVTGRGPDVPVASNDTREGRARNRRVEIILSGDLVKESR